MLNRKGELMPLQTLWVSVLFTALLAGVTWKLFIETDVGMDKPMKLDDTEYSNDFGTWLTTLSEEEHAAITSYIDRWDRGELKPGEPDWYEEDVTTRDLLGELDGR